jgi:NAD(P)-dependent dehydrogenase (short-subunit alcohol dehydrogenase family)
MRLKGMVAVVTGGGQGIGEAVATEMAKEGAKLVLIDINQKETSRVVKCIEKAGGEAKQLQVDVGSGKEVKEAADNIVKQFGRIDILVNSAGIALIEHFAEGDEKAWDKMINVNLTGTMMFCQAVLPGMVKRQYGKIVNIASGVALQGANRQVVYSATKGGVAAFTRSLAAEVARYHINVNSVCPGFVDTPMTAVAKENLPEFYKKMVKVIPWGRAAMPADIANMVLFLSSDDSEYITGQNILVDGGMTGV